jgi:hypothetical protein
MSKNHIPARVRRALLGARACGAFSRTSAAIFACIAIACIAIACAAGCERRAPAAERELPESERLEKEKQQRRQRELDRLGTTEEDLAAAKRQIGIWASSVLKNADRKRAEKKRLEAFIAQCDEAEAEVSKAFNTTRIATTNINKNVVGSKTLAFTNIATRAVSGDGRRKMISDAIAKAPPELIPKLENAFGSIKQEARAPGQNAAMDSNQFRADADAIVMTENRWNGANNEMLAARVAAEKLRHRLKLLEAEYSQNRTVFHRYGYYNGGIYYYHNRTTPRERMMLRSMRSLSAIENEMSRVRSEINAENNKAAAAERRRDSIAPSISAQREKAQKNAQNSQLDAENSVRDNMRPARSPASEIFDAAKSEKRAKIIEIDNDLETASELKNTLPQLTPEQIIRIRAKISTQAKHR